MNIQGAWRTWSTYRHCPGTLENGKIGAETGRNSNFSSNRSAFRITITSIISCNSRAFPQMFRSSLNTRPTIVPSDLVPTELLVAIGVADAGVDVVVVKHPAFGRIVVNALSTWTVDVVVGFENGGAAAFGAGGAVGVDLVSVLARDRD